MTSIEKLHISGIRSFNPNPAARQTIEFQKPLTIILGKNGAGKTTIIEALLNATTGEMPPGAAAGEKSAFVYDPKALGGESEVKAQIRLVFTGKGGKAMQVIRSFQATRSKGKTKFETLDAVLACKDDSSGKVQSATYRSSDCDRMVPELLGVPKAVLEHVIFCHQEDCNWPLGAPSEVKKRFDDIFASTRYVAALDKLREISKEYKDLQKDNEGVLIALREHRETAKQLTAEVEEKQEQVRIIEARTKEIEPRLKQLSAAVQAIDAESHRIETMLQEVAIVRGRVAEKERSIRQLQEQRRASGHAAPPQQTLEELVVLQREFMATVQRFAADLNIQQGKLTAAEASRRSAANACGDARGALTALEHEATNHKRRVAELQRLISSMTTDFVAGEGEFDTAALDRVAQLMVTKVNEAKDALAQLAASHGQRLAALQTERENALRFIDAEGKERDLKETQIAALQQRIQAAQQSRPNVVATPAEVERLQHEIRDLADQVNREAEARRNGTASREVDELLTTIETCQRQTKELSDALAKSKDNAETALRMGFLRTATEDRTRQAAAAVAEQIIPNLRAIGATISDGDTSLATVSAAAAVVKQRKVKALAQADDDARQADRDAAGLHQSHQHVQQRLQALQRDVAQRRAVVASVVGNGDPDGYKVLPQLLVDAEERLLRASRKLTSLQSMAKCYESFIASARSEHSCVVCKRGLDEAGVENFVRINEERQRTTPAQIESAKREQADAAAAVEQLRKAAPLAETIRLLLEEAELIKVTAASHEEALGTKRALLADLTTKRRELQKQLEQVDAVVQHLARLEESQNDTQKIVNELAELEAASAPHTKSNLPPRDVLQREYDQKAALLRELNAKLLVLQRNAAAETAQGAGGRQLEDQLLAKRTQLGQLQVAINRNEDIDQTISAATSELNAHRTRLTAIAARKVELQKSLDATVARIAELDAAHKAQLHAAQAKVSAAEKNVTLLNESSRVVKEYLSRSSVESLEAARHQLRNHEASMKQIDDEVKALNEAIANRRATMDEQHKHQQDLADCIKLLELQREVDRDKASIAKAEASLTALRDEKLREVAPIIGSVDGDSNDSAVSIITKARDRCRAKASELERARAQNTGALETLAAAIAEKKAALHKDKYRDIDNRYAATFIKVQTTEHAIEDIEKYYRALERAVSSYHAEKVAQINKIVSELWRSTYRGSDIDSIEIKSEDDSSGSIARRSYKYRVVMKRGDTELDMRGRCSAGQKVLAAVIIRMALSEAFCCDCGILALDEPTTNLDDDNAKALAESLRELISARRYVSHFQLIVITHDEEFVRTLGGGHRAEHFYYVQKDRDGTFSTITQRRFGELFV